MPRSKRSKRHHKAALCKDVPAIVQSQQANHEAADTAVKLAAEYIILTAVRTGEARLMGVREVGFGARLWTVPAERTKAEDHPAGKNFEVQLCDRAIPILKAVIPKDAARDTYVFAGQWSKDHTKPLGMNAVLHALKAVYLAMTTHECRSSFRDWPGDETRFEREIAEMALAHKVGDETEQAYRRGNGLKRWRHVASASNVIPLPSREPA